MRTAKAREWEKKLKHVFDEIDRILETEYSGYFTRHPNRPPEGTTSNPEMDGLINVGASYSAGFGSEFGPGYVVSIRISTLGRVPDTVKQEMRDNVQHLLQEKLPSVFPENQLFVDQEKNHLRIHGDLSLD
ncbi:hypothetical protein [Pontiella agarivorans]|uniref:Uncharacterized protein n=1 Tax=Pontiella agarivorans TaxID=3038953 RepID=A0ABU5N1Y3_9BACT|nr:hypothetical protein [Pontiella agarivorans]MDZ8120460.1 hypothetical protein [Pontiella agarivorans]